MPVRSRSGSGSLSMRELLPPAETVVPSRSHHQPGSGSARSDHAVSPQRRPRFVLGAVSRQSQPNLDVADGRFSLGLRLGGRGQVVVVLQISDDCSRLDLALRAASSENAVEVWDAVLWAMQRTGFPSRLLTDNGSAFSGARRGWVSPHLEENRRRPQMSHPSTSSVAPPADLRQERARSRHGPASGWPANRPPLESLEQLQSLLDCLPCPLQRPTPQNPP